MMSSNRMGEMQPNQKSSDVEQREKEMESLQQRMREMEGQLNQTRYDLEQREDEVLSLIWRMSKLDYSHQDQPMSMGKMKEELNQTRSDVEQREKEMESLIWRMGEIEGHLNSIRSDPEQRGKEVESLQQRMGEMDGHLKSIRSDVEQRKKEMESLQQRVTEMEHSNQQKKQDPSMEKMKEELETTSSVLEQGEKEMKSLQQSMKKKEEELEKTISDLEQRKKEMESLQQSMKKKEEELHQTRSALNEKDKELKSFKDRVAADVSISMKTARRLENMNSPISTTRLKEMYEELHRQWRKIKTDLKSNEETPETVKKMIQEKFKKAKLAMEVKKTQIDEMFGLDEASRGSASEKVQQCWLSTCQNLQLVLYHGRTEDADLKTPSSPCEGGKPQDVMESLSSRCYWLGCLMALNNPPLQPDWENHDPGMDKWNFFPRKLTDASGK